MLTTWIIFVPWMQIFHCKTRHFPPKFFVFPFFQQNFLNIYFFLLKSKSKSIQRRNRFTKQNWAWRILWMERMSEKYCRKIDVSFKAGKALNSSIHLNENDFSRIKSFRYPSQAGKARHSSRQILSMHSVAWAHLLCSTVAVNRTANGMQRIPTISEYRANRPLKFT